MPSGQIQLRYWKVNTVDTLHCWIITQWINWIRCPWVEEEKLPSSHLSLAVSFQFTPWFMRLHWLSHDAGNSHLTYCMWHHGVNEIQLVPQSLCTATFFFKLANWLPFAPFCIQTPAWPVQHNHTNTQTLGQNDPLMVWNTLSDWSTGHSSSRVQLLWQHISCLWVHDQYRKQKKISAWIVGAFRTDG